MQLGWYEDTENAESVYYTSYCSSDMSAFDQNLEQTTKDIEALFGVKVDIEKLKSASKDAFEKVIENEYYYIYEQDAKVTFEDYTETVALTMEVGDSQASQCHRAHVLAQENTVDDIINRGYDLADHSGECINPKEFFESFGFQFFGGI